ncbi:MAG: oligosaccharide flippase family protein [Nitrososphaerota archaeon]|nr:oligosaccharide flippase family protein [Nitrososphaerota archaeon]
MYTGRAAARGSLLLLVGNFLAAAGAILAQALIGRLLGPDEFGLFSLAVVSASIFQLLVGMGAGVAATRFVAAFVSSGDLDRAREFTGNATALTLLTGVGIAAFCYLAAPAIAQGIFNRPELAPYVRIAAFAIAGQGVLQGTIAAAIGWNAMGLASISTVAQAFGRAAVAPALILVGGTAGAVAGHSLSWIFPAVLFTGILFRSPVRSRLSLRNFTSDVRQMVSYGFPAFLANALNGLGPYYVSAVLSVIGTETLVGYYQAAWNFTVPVTLLSGAVTMANFPAFAMLNRGDGDPLKAFRLSVKYLSYAAVPLILFTAGAASNLMFVFYGRYFAGGVQFIVLLALTNLPIVVGFNVFPSYLNGVDRTKATLAMISAEAAAVFVLAPLLGGYLGLGVPGLALAIFCSNVVSTAVGLALVGVRRGSPVDLKSGGLMVASSLVALGAVLAFPALPGNLIPLLLKMAAFSAVYLTATAALGALTPEDLEVIDGLLAEMRPVRRLAAQVFRYYAAVYAAARGRGSGRGEPA